jgi:large subunit ribosomal protein L29
MSDKLVKKFSGMTEKELLESLSSSKKELLNLRFQSASGELSNTSRFKQVRKDIARISTFITHRKSGGSNA